jgi:hypothetical protein
MDHEIMAKKQSRPEIAVRLIQQLDGLSIADAKAALERAIELLAITQVVSKNDFSKKCLLI